MVETRSRASRASASTATRTAAGAGATATRTATLPSATGAETASSARAGPSLAQTGATRSSASSARPTPQLRVDASSSAAKAGASSALSSGRRVASTSVAAAAAPTSSSRYARASTASTRQSTLVNNPVPPQLTSIGQSARTSQRPSVASFTGRASYQRDSVRLSHSHAATPVAASASSHHSYNTRKNNAVHTVNELIDGKIEQVYVLDDDEDEEDRPPSASTSLAAHHLNGGHHHSSYLGHPPAGAGAHGGHPPRPSASDYGLPYPGARGQAGTVAGAHGSAGYRPSPRLNGSVLRGASTASGRGSALPGGASHQPYSSSMLAPSAASTTGAGKGKRKARDDGTTSQQSSYYPSSAAGTSHYGHPASHLLSVQGQVHSGSSPALSTSSTAPHGALDRAMQAQQRAAAAAAAAAASASGQDGHYDGSQASSAAGSAAAAAALAKRRRRDADGTYAATGAGSAYHPSAATGHGTQHYVGSGGSGKVGSGTSRHAPDYAIISSRHANNTAAAGTEYYAAPSGTGAAHIPVSSKPHIAVPSSYRGGYPAGQGYIESQYAASAEVAPPVEELPCDDKEGHYIVRPGEYVGSRYRIVNLLGQGTFGKVVECVDVKTRRHVAVKVIRAIQKYRDASQIEIRVLKTLKDHDPLNEHQCIHLIEHFTFRNHVCIVSELLGKSVFDFLKENDFAPFPSMHIWSFAKQLLKSVAFLHRLNLIHTDLKPENILLVSSESEPVRIGTSTGGSGGRRQPKVRNMLRSTEIRLIDFGSATFDHEYHSAVVSTRHYRAPEIILGMGWSFPCDAWSIGCILVEFFTGDALFQTHDNLEHLAMMEAVLGVMPEHYRRQAEIYKPELFRQGRLNFPNPDVPKQSKRYVRQMKKLQDIIGSGGSGSGGSSSGAAATYQKHNHCFVNLVRRLLDFDPQRRITVSDALNHPYFDLVEHEFPP